MATPTTTRTTHGRLPWRILDVLEAWHAPMHLGCLAFILQVQRKYVAICCARMVRDGRLAHVGQGLYAPRTEARP